MKTWIQLFMSQYGYLAVALLIAIENIFPPIPSEIILTFGGFMTTYTSLNLILMIFFSTVGSVAGAIILYAVGRLLNIDRIERLLDGKIGRISRIKASDIKKAEHWFNHKGKSAVFICRFIPIVRSLISIPAGMTNMNLGIFFLYTTLGTAIWNMVLVSLGAWAGESWNDIVVIMERYSYVILILLVFLCFLAIIYFLKKKNSKNA